MSGRTLSQEKPPVTAIGNGVAEKLRRIRAAKKSPSVKASLFVKCDRELYSKIVAKAATEGVRPSELIRTVLEDYVQRECGK